MMEEGESTWCKVEKHPRSQTHTHTQKFTTGSIKPGVSEAAHLKSDTPEPFDSTRAGTAK